MTWMEDYKLFLEVQKFVDEQLWRPHVLVSRFGAEANLRLHMGSPCDEMVRNDPCDGGLPPYHDVSPGYTTDLTKQIVAPANTTGAQPSTVWGADLNISRFGGDRTSQLASANLHMSDLFNAVLSGAAAPATDFRPLAESSYAGHVRNLAERATSGGVAAPFTPSSRNEPPADTSGDDDGGSDDSGGGGGGDESGGEGGTPPSISPGGTGGTGGRTRSG
jgi:hypothetical protein